MTIRLSGKYVNQTTPAFSHLSLSKERSAGPTVVLS